jgi:hypothetical protein
MPSNKPSNIFLNSSFYKYANLASFNDSTAIYELKYAKDGTKMKTKIIAIIIEAIVSKFISLKSYYYHITEPKQKA